MPTTALALALGAAFLHAFWNLLLARAPDIEAATAVALVVGVVAFAPVTAIAWEADAQVWPYLVVTSLLQLTYFVLLTTAYGRADLSFVYPIARGSAPVIVLLAAVAVLGDAASAAQVAGVLVIAAGVLLVRGIGGHATSGDLALALAVGGCIAAYTLVDSRGIQYASPIVYQELSMIPAAVAFLVLTFRRRGRDAVRAAAGLASVAAGLATFGAYILVLAALARAPAASVAAVRETSVVIATLLAVPSPARAGRAGPDCRRRARRPRRLSFSRSSRHATSRRLVLPHRAQGASREQPRLPRAETRRVPARGSLRPAVVSTWRSMYSPVARVSPLPRASESGRGGAASRRPRGPASRRRAARPPRRLVQVADVPLDRVGAVA